ncbi:HD domain-containing phosphohydrolase [Limisalsivibrio acetivorans]|uniref:HD domain-containing phosphohydrolase n=1 Tax=Limisalsivibrio acetivorans TaxID=1304888 RepID=UPI0003B43E3D|nr:HD domain-containing phosphohydrolase [Limisalsivibrio acetivorans]
MLENLKAVSVDDSEVNLFFIEAMAAKLGLSVVSFSDPLEALTYVRENDVDLIFVDYMMPNIDGITFIKEARKVHSDAPIVMITAVSDDNDVKMEALESGATEFLSKPVNGAEFTVRVKNLGALRSSQLLLANKALLLQEEVSKATEDIRQREYETLNVIGKTAEFKDPETGHHIQRVAHYCKIISSSIGASEEFQSIIFHSAPLHDLGKVGIADSILLKPGKLTDEEFDVMKSHTTIGYEILLNTKSPFLETGANIALTHHERFNGTGYPNGLTRENIPLEGRIVAIADVFDALTTRRPYKDPWPFQKALDLLESEKGKHFDPKLVDHFFKNLGSIQQIYDDLSDR